MRTGARSLFVNRFELTLALTCSKCDWIELTGPFNPRMREAEARKRFDQHNCCDFQKPEQVDNVKQDALRSA